MARCAAITKSGERCKREALPGSLFCAIHQNYDGPLAPGVLPEEVETKEGDVVATKRPYKKFRIRYLGRGTYTVRGYLFKEYGEVKEVPRDLFEYLLQQEGWFEEA